MKPIVKVCSLNPSLNWLIRSDWPSASGGMWWTTNKAIGPLTGTSKYNKRKPVIKKKKKKIAVHQLLHYMLTRSIICFKYNNQLALQWTGVLYRMYFLLIPRIHHYPERIKWSLNMSEWIFRQIVPIWSIIQYSISFVHLKSTCVSY